MFSFFKKNKKHTNWQGVCYSFNINFNRKQKVFWNSKHNLNLPAINCKWNEPKRVLVATKSIVRKYFWFRGIYFITDWFQCFSFADIQRKSKKNYVSQFIAKGKIPADLRYANFLKLWNEMWCELKIFI